MWPSLGGKLLGLTGIALTFLKPVFGWLVVFLIAKQNTGSAATGIALLMVSDIFDGVLFRRSPYAANATLGTVRRVADAVGDIASVIIVLVAMMVFSGFPLWLSFIPLAHALVILALMIYGRAARKPWSMNMPTRLAGANIGLMAIFWLLGVPYTTYACAGLTVFFAGVNLIQYRRATYIRTVSRP